MMKKMLAVACAGLMMSVAAIPSAEAGGFHGGGRGFGGGHGFGGRSVVFRGGGYGFRGGYRGGYRHYGYGRPYGYYGPGYGYGYYGGPDAGAVAMGAALGLFGAALAGAAVGY